MMKTKLKFNQMLVRTVLPAAVILLSFYSCSTKKTNNRIVLNKEYKKEILDGRESLKVHLISSSAPGVSVSVSIDGETVWSEGMGYANRELKVPAIPETKYRIGRTSQIFTAYLIAKLQEEGKLDVNKSFYDYIADYPKKQWDFNLLQLGVHSAGFAESKKGDLLKKDDLKSLKQYITEYQNDSLLYKPDSYYTISDYGTCLLGILAEDITKTTYSKLVKEMILDTLGMSETLADSPNQIIENRSGAYYQNYIAQLINAPQIDLRFCLPANGFLSTADDLNKAGQAVLKTGFFKQKSLDLFFTNYHLANNYEINRGFGWWISTDNESRKIYAQVGSTIGGSSMLLVYPDQKLVVSICSNIDDDMARIPAQKIAEIFLEKIDPRKSPTENKDSNKN